MSDFIKFKMARMMPTSRDYILSKYKVHQLKAIEDFVAETVEVSVVLYVPLCKSSV
jgi:homocitrate synthase